jgi:hypothetical protein
MVGRFPGSDIGRIERYPAHIVIRIPYCVPERPRSCSESSDRCSEYSIYVPKSFDFLKVYHRPVHCASNFALPFVLVGEVRGKFLDIRDHVSGHYDL